MLPSMLEQASVQARRAAQDLESSRKTLLERTELTVKTARTSSAALIREVTGQGPKKTLARGFAVVKSKSGKTVTSAKAAKAAGTMEVTFNDGAVQAFVHGDISNKEGGSRMAESTMTFREAYGVLQQHAETLRNQTEPNIDDLLPMVEQSVAAYRVCKERIDAVEKALEKALTNVATDAAPRSGSTKAPRDRHPHPRHRGLLRPRVPRMASTTWTTTRRSDAKPQRAESRRPRRSGSSKLASTALRKPCAWLTSARALRWTNSRPNSGLAGVCEARHPTLCATKWVVLHAAMMFELARTRN